MGCSRRIIGLIAFPIDNSPKAYRMLRSFCPSSDLRTRSFSQSNADVLLKGMKIASGLTLGLMAWDRRDRSTAVKRYAEALELAFSHPPFFRRATSDSGVRLERWVMSDVEVIQDNLDILLRNDTANLGRLGGYATERRSIVAIRNTRIEGNGTIRLGSEFMVATDTCQNCGKRGIRLQQCSSCMNARCASLSMLMC